MSRTVTICPKCQHILVAGSPCQACAIRKGHKGNCLYRIAATGGVGIECDHGRDVCAICDPCTCAGGKE